MDDLLVVHEHAVRHGIVVADNAVHKFMHEGIWLEAELPIAKWTIAPRKLAPGLLPCVCQPVIQPCRYAGSLRHAADTGGKIHAFACSQ